MHQIVHIKYVLLLVYWLELNEAILKKNKEDIFARTQIKN